jgi:hypothetical protein
MPHGGAEAASSVSLCLFYITMLEGTKQQCGSHVACHAVTYVDALSNH